MAETLMNRWLRLGQSVTDDQALLEQLWQQLKRHYTESHRAYHTLAHLQAMFLAWDQFAGEMERPDRVACSIFYHDIIYHPARKDNEVKSAEVLLKSMELLGMDEADKEVCFAQIIATKDHHLSEGADEDTAYLLDIDLEILGKPWETYLRYSQAIRKEYRIFPRPIYRAGRKKALKALLARPKLYHTGYFVDQYEAVARENMQRELMEL